MKKDRAFTEQFLSDLRTLNQQVERAAHSWTIFLESARNFDSESQKALIKAIDEREIGVTLNHIQMVLLHDCVSSLNRVTDKHRPDRITMYSVSLHIRKCFRASEPEKLKKIERKRKAILKSPKLVELRTFRNNELGHTLRTDTPPTKYDAIPTLIVDISDWLSDVFYLFGYAQWVGQSTPVHLKKSASKFWSCIEDGLGPRVGSDKQT